MAQKIFVAVENSSLFDIALNTYGSVDFIGKLLADNPDNGLNLYPTAGTQFVWDDSLQISQTNAILGGSGMFVGQKYATRPTDEPQANFAPVNILPPTLSGAISVGSTLTCIPGSFSGLPTPASSFQWQSSTNGGITWGDISGQIATTYVIQPTDDGKLIRCNQIATNPLGTAERASAFVAPYSASTSSVPPSNSTLPSIVVCGGGSPIVGAYLVVNIGTWLGDSPITYNVTWKRGATTVGTQLFYQVQSADFGQTITCEVEGVNAYGNATAITPNITGLSIPVNTVAPVASGLTPVGSTLSVTAGTWTGNGPITQAYQWLRNGAVISGEINTTYVSVLADMGQVITCRVTSSNAYGNAVVVSNAITVTKVPSIVDAPIVYGVPSVGSVLSAFTGNWSEFPASTKTYQWQRSTDNGSTWSNLSTGTTYTVVSGDVGNLLRVRITATNSDGPATANSNNFTIPAATVQRPVNTVAPAITGNPYIGQVLTCSTGTWTNSPTGYDYQWYRGTTAVGTNSNTYTPVIGDVDSIIKCVVSATNAGGVEPVDSNLVYAYDADFYAVVNYAVANSIALPSERQLQLFSRMVTQIKAIGYWTTMDAFWFMANDNNANFGRINWRNPSVGYLTPVSAPTWVANTGYVFGGANYIDTNFNPATMGVNYTLNSAGRYAFIPSRTTTNNGIIDGNAVALNDNSMRISNSSQLNTINQGTTVLTAAVITNHAYWQSIVRTSSSVVTITKDIAFANTATSSSVASSNQWIGRTGTTTPLYAFNGQSIAFYALGGPIDAGDILSYRNIIMKTFYNL